MLYESMKQVAVAAAAVGKQWTGRPEIGLILGTGLGGVTRHIQLEARFGYEQIPSFPRPTAPGHAGQWICGRLGDTNVIAIDGRCHLFEGYSAAQASFSVRVMHALGIKTLVVASAVGGLNPNYRTGDIMLIEDQINLTFHNPLVGPHDSASGLGYPDMSCPYCRALIDRALAVARQSDFVAHQGVYVGVMGPNYETRAEYRMLRRLGADAVGMSTVCEVIAAAQCGLQVLGLSVVTNVGLPDRLEVTDGQQVQNSAAAAEPKVAAILRGIVGQT
jgi:purine-nucleoside phosphorylase